MAREIITVCCEAYMGHESLCSTQIVLKLALAVPLGFETSVIN
jgi:hypothetical protein